MDDWQLLQNYVERNSEGAFHTLVARHIDMVHSSALRQLQNDSQLAEEVTQAVFILLARKAGSFREGIILPSWLFRTTRFVAARAIRTERRRQHREQEAFQMQSLSSSDEAWSRIAPFLDEGLEELGDKDRTAVVLRFLQGKSLRDVGSVMGTTEDAAKKRVSRAVEKLRSFFESKGFKVSATTVSTALATQSVQAAPAGLAGSIAGQAFLSSAGTTLPVLVRETLAAWRWAKLKITGLGAGLGVAIVATMISFNPSSTPSSSSEPASNDRRLAAGQPEASSNAAPVPEDAPPILDDPHTLRLRVVSSETDKPIGGAQIALNTVANDKWKQRYDLITDELGFCRIVYPENVSRLDVGVLPSGWGARFATWVPRKDDPIPTEYVLRVAPTTNSIRGSFVDKDQQPIAGVELWITFNTGGDVSNRETPRERAGFVESVPIARTGADGTWSCQTVPHGYFFSLEGKHPDFANTAVSLPRDRTSDPQKLAELQQESIVTVMKKGRTFTGTVRTESGEPIVGAKITTGTQSPTFKTDDEGVFIISQLIGDDHEFTFSAEGFSPERHEIDLASISGPWELQLKPGGKLRLRVVDETGGEIPGASVILEQWGEHRHALEWTGVSDAEGRIEWNSAPVDVPLEFCAKKHGYCYTRNVRLTAGEEQHTIHLRRELTVTGRAVDAHTGEPLREFKAYPGYGKAINAWERFDTRRGTNGVFHIPLSENEMPWRIRVESPGYEPATSDPIPPTFNEVLELRLTPLRSTTIQGVVLLPDGSPASGAQIALCTIEHEATLDGTALIPERYGGLLTNARVDGQFEFPFDVLAHTVVAAHENGFAKVTLEINSPTRLQLRLRPWGRIQGTVQRAYDKQVTKVHITDLAEHKYRGPIVLESDFAEIDDEGNFVIDPLPPGDFCLWLFHGPGKRFSHRTPVGVRPGETTTVTITDRIRVTGRFEANGVEITNWISQAGHPRLDAQNNPTWPPKNLSIEAREKWNAIFWQSEKGIEQLRSIRSQAVFTVKEDGSFFSDDVMPGEFEFQATINATGKDQTAGKRWLQIKRPVLIPEIDVIPGIRNTFDLGIITVGD